MGGTVQTKLRVSDKKGSVGDRPKMMSNKTTRAMRLAAVLMVIIFAVLPPFNAHGALVPITYSQIFKTETKIRIMAVGDNLYHDRVIKSGMKSDGTIDYRPIYKHIKDYLSNADIRIVNQEVILTPVSSRWKGYPDFASPYEVGDALVDAGFNVVTHATNHSWDNGKSGAQYTVDYWKSQKDVLMTGMYGTAHDYQMLTIGEYNGIKVAFLNYTYGLNGSDNPTGGEYMFKLLDMSLVEKEIKRAKKLADVVIVLPHWGKEYKFEANDDQKEMAKEMAELGADLIIGCHPHVIEPLEFIETSDGRSVPCYYSLGNFVSNMLQPERCIEAMADVTISVSDGKVTVESARAIPLVNYINKDCTKYAVYLFDDYTDKIAKTHESTMLTRNYVKVMWKEVFGEDIG